MSTPYNQLLAGGASGAVQSSAMPMQQQADPSQQQASSQQAATPDLEKIAAIRDELLAMRAANPSMAPYIDQAIQSLVDGLSTTMQGQEQAQGQQQPMPQQQQGSPQMAQPY